MPKIGSAGVAGDRSTEQQFLDLLLADEELLRAEFDAIIAAEWPGPPPNLPHRRVGGEPGPREERRHPAPATAARGVGRRSRGEGSARQRSPPAEERQRPTS